MSWLSRFKKSSSSSEQEPGNEAWKGKVKSPSPSSARRVSWNEGRFYGGDDDSYWRLSFGDDKSRGGSKSAWYGSDDDLIVPFSSPQSFKMRDIKMPGREGNSQFGNGVSERRKISESPLRVESRQANEAWQGKNYNEEAEYELENALSQTSGRNEEEKEEHSERSTEAIIFQVEKHCQKPTSSDLRQPQSISFSNSNIKTTEEDCATEAVNSKQTNSFTEDDLISEWQKLEDVKISVAALKSENQRKTVYISKGSQRREVKQSKVRVKSPRTAAKIECKIKRLEDVKKAKKKTKKMRKVRMVNQATAFDSFAVVKSSVDPQQDFRDSMIEMIIEKGIRQQEELEELLVCYLTLNSDEYHDIIIKTFRQVWFDLNQVHFDPESSIEQCYKN
ncbi:hypothetical protein RJ639_019618 [Escallonia herrerae]|uniref:Transcription repressor n=1 Tax=Escallonia herrerae TaxID=1293975 RepID=A0AA88V8R8_9ASTE|nr:hypothetical protein RJ639_019618 [Escallonia herrerae]